MGPVDEIQAMMEGGERAPCRADADFSVESNLDSLVAKAVSEMASAYAKKAAAEVEVALKAYVEAELKGTLSAERIEELVALAEGDHAAATAKAKQEAAAALTRGLENRRMRPETFSV